MKICKKMDLGGLAQLIPAGFDAKKVRARLVLVADGADTDSLSPEDWQTVCNERAPTSADVDQMLKENGLFWLHFNRKTKEIVHGISSDIKMGDKSIDRSWVGFEVRASTPEDAEKMVRTYIAHPNAKYTGMVVRICNGVGVCADESATPIPVVEVTWAKNGEGLI